MRHKCAENKRSWKHDSIEVCLIFSLHHFNNQVISHRQLYTNTDSLRARRSPCSLKSLGHEERLLVRLSAEEVDEHVHGVHGSAAGEDLGAVVLADGGVEEALPVGLIKDFETLLQKYN